MSKPRNNPTENYHGLRNIKIIPWSEEYKNNSMVGKIQTIISWSKKYKQ